MGVHMSLSTLLHALFFFFSLPFGTSFPCIFVTLYPHIHVMSNESHEKCYSLHRLFFLRVVSYDILVSCCAFPCCIASFCIVLWGFFWLVTARLRLVLVSSPRWTEKYQSCRSKAHFCGNSSRRCLFVMSRWLVSGKASHYRSIIDG